MSCAPGAIRTHTERDLNPLPLPLGYRRRLHPRTAPPRGVPPGLSVSTKTCPNLRMLSARRLAPWREVESNHRSGRYPADLPLIESPQVSSFTSCSGRSATSSRLPRAGILRRLSQLGTRLNHQRTDLAGTPPLTIYPECASGTRTPKSASRATVSGGNRRPPTAPPAKAPTTPHRDRRMYRQRSPRPMSRDAPHGLRQRACKATV